MRKIKRNIGSRYYTQTGNIITATNFQNKDSYCRKICIKNYTEENRKKALENVHTHIKNFLVFESHYTRSHNPNRKYLHPDLTVKKLFDFYKLH